MTAPACEARVLPLTEARARRCGKTPTARVGDRHLCKRHATVARKRLCAGNACTSSEHDVTAEPAGSDGLCPHGIPVGAEVEPCTECLRAQREFSSNEVPR